jgi:tetratricopeptide (TPR) repeat protein
MNTCFRLTGIGVLAAAALLSQGPAPGLGSSIRGEITPVPAGISSLTVELSATGGAPSDTARIGPDGTFEFRFAQRGTYELRVCTADGSVIHQETVVLTGGNQMLSVRLSSPTPVRRDGGTVSIHQLSHKVPGAARKAFERGEQAENKGHYEEAAGLFRHAVEIDPQFADAFNELGAMDVKQGDLSHAAEHFQKAIDAVPDHRLALPNLSIVLAKQRRFDEACAAARRALQVVPDSATVRFVLATSLLVTRGDSDEVLDNLVRAAGEVPRAHLLAAQLLAQRGKRSEAAQHAQDFLRAVPSDDRDRERAQALLGELNQ